MIQAELCTKITFDEVKDRERIRTALCVVAEIRSEMKKTGCYTETEEEALNVTMEILDKILDGGVF